MNEPNPDLKTEEKSATSLSTRSCRNGWRMKLFFSLIILLCGMVIGVVATLGFIRYTFNNFQFKPEIATQRVMARFNSKYDLTKQQQEKIEMIVREHFNQLEQIGMEVHPRIRSQMDQFGEKIAKELNDEQRADWLKRFQFLRENFLPREPFRK